MRSAETELALPRDDVGAPPFPAEPGPRSVVIDGRYLLVQRIGQGATGEVFAALHLGLKRRAAVKLLHAEAALDDAARRRFEREALALGRLRHPNVVQVTDYGVDPASGAPFLAMELIDGISLAQLCRTQGALPPAEAIPILSAVAAALDAAHAQGVLHRDLKPENVLLARAEGARPVVKVLDFGLAKLIGESDRWEPRTGASEARPPMPSTSGTGALLGTPLYLAPELIQGQTASRASDVYSFGILTYQLLSGEAPFVGSLTEVLTGHCHLPPPPPADPQLRAPAVMSALLAPLRKDPAQRPGSASAAVTALRRALEHDTRRRTLRREAPRRLAWAGLATLAAATGVLALAPRGVEPLERWSYDWRLSTVPARAPDPRILLVTLDDEPGRGRPLLGERADHVAAGIERLFAAGAATVAIDLVLPARWSESGRFAATIVRHADRLTLAASSGAEGARGEEALAGLATAALGTTKTLELFGFTNTVEDSDGVNRRSRSSFHDRAGNERPSFAAHATKRLRDSMGSTEHPHPDSGLFRIDHRIAATRYETVALPALEGWLQEHPDRLRGRLVLLGVGGSAESEDLHRVPARGGGTRQIPGLVLQALAIDTLLADRPLRDAPPSGWLVPGMLGAAVLVVTGLAVSLLLWGRWRWVLLAAAGLWVLHLAAAWWLFRGAGLVVPMTPPILITAVTLPLVWPLQRGSARGTGAELEP